MMYWTGYFIGVSLTIGAYFFDSINFLSIAIGMAIGAIIMIIYSIYKEDY